MSRVRRGILAFDTHYPKTHWPTFHALLSFCRQNPMDFFIWGGDQMDNQEVSPHTRGKPKLRCEAGTLADNDAGFLRDVLVPVERVLRKGTTRVWIDGNHCHWRDQLVEEQPELDGIQTWKRLDVKGRGWKYVPCGEHYQLGPYLTVIHGEQISGVGNQNPATPAKKALDIYASNVLMGHFHSPQMATRILPFDRSGKWQSYVSPILGETNPHYLRNRPTAWLNGFTYVELSPKGTFNVYLINVISGEFCFGGRLYR